MLAGAVGRRAVYVSGVAMHTYQVCCPRSDTTYYNIGKYLSNYLM